MLGINNYKVYTAESCAKDLKSVFRAMLSGMLDGRYLARRLFIKEIKSDYSRSKFGVFWDFLEPITLALIFILLRKSNVINVGDIKIPYAVFVVFGLMLWQTFHESITYPLQSMGKQRELLKQVKIPPEALILSIFMKVSFNSIFRVITLLLVVVYMDSFLWIGFLKFIILYPSIIILGISIGIILAPFNVIYSDVGRMVTIILRPLLYASPVLYSISSITILKYFNIVNPIGIVISNLRTVATLNSFCNLQAFLISNAVLFIIFFVGWFVFHLSIPILSDKL